ncbi:glycerate kinase [Microbacterium sp. BG28]|uniref:glycerate kinase n=1 Tax=Microbacterium sp. BG28 TaxID=3097356 RepID=UPI002A59CC2E|nr:glycerate kinase [Microbacterium sp. BG28]MDY0828077.1 glycerate kinase [Microbacterium sp. BG28]
MSAATSPARSRIVVAPDSFKGSIDATSAAGALAEGWRSVRPDDELLLRPMADGGEGTLDAFAAAMPEARRMPVAVTGPTGRRIDSHWLMLPGERPRTAVVELACTSGIELVGADETVNPLATHTLGFGQAIRAALAAGATRLLLGIGGSVSSDGGAGVLTALGAVVRDAHGRQVASGAAGLARAASFDAERLIPPPVDGILVLSDVRAPLLGPDGAARVFAPQKGADPDQVDRIETALTRWARVVGADPDGAGAGAAGGCGFGLVAWGAQLASGADAVAETIGLDAALAGAVRVITGEGSYDSQSLLGKAPGVVRAYAEARGVPVSVVAGRFGVAAGADDLSLVDVAGSPSAALSDPRRWLREAGARLARRHTGRDSV